MRITVAPQSPCTSLPGLPQDLQLQVLEVLPPIDRVRAARAIGSASLAAHTLRRHGAWLERRGAGMRLPDLRAAAACGEASAWRAFVLPVPLDFAMAGLAGATLARVIFAPLAEGYDQNQARQAAFFCVAAGCLMGCFYGRLGVFLPHALSSWLNHGILALLRSPTHLGLAPSRLQARLQRLEAATEHLDTSGRLQAQMRRSTGGPQVLNLASFIDGLEGSEQALAPAAARRQRCIAQGLLRALERQLAENAPVLQSLHAHLRNLDTVQTRADLQDGCRADLSRCLVRGQLARDLWPTFFAAHPLCEALLASFAFSLGCEAADVTWAQGLYPAEMRDDARALWANDRTMTLHWTLAQPWSGFLGLPPPMLQDHRLLARERLLALPLDWSAWLRGAGRGPAQEVRRRVMALSPARRAAYPRLLAALAEFTPAAP